MRLDEDNGKDMGRVSIGKVWWFPSNEYWKDIGCLVFEPTFGVGVSRLWYKKNGGYISGKKMERK